MEPDRNERLAITVLLIIAAMLFFAAKGILFPKYVGKPFIAEKTGTVIITGIDDSAIFGTAFRISARSASDESEPVRVYYISDQVADRFGCRDLNYGDEAFMYRAVVYHKCTITEKVFHGVLEKFYDYTEGAMKIGQPVGVHETVISKLELITNQSGNGDAIY